MGAPAVKLALGILFAGSMAVAPLGHATEVAISNELSACVAVKPGKVRAQSNVIMSQVVFEVRKPIGECRCMSALAVYESSVDRAGVKQTLQQGVIGLKGSGEKMLVLATEPALLVDKKVSVTISCAGSL